MALLQRGNCSVVCVKIKTGAVENDKKTLCKKYVNVTGIKETALTSETRCSCLNHFYCFSRLKIPSVHNFVFVQATF